MKRWGYIVFALLFGLVGQGCSSRAIHEAEAVVAQADSLWHEGKQYGIDEGDSATLAQAYETLGAYQFLSPFTFHPSSSFTHSCYHYGKLLRAKDNPVEAMQAFINATHSRTRDYNILGRVYSNMGDLCHLANVYALSYDMYERSGQMYLLNGDSLLYFYDLNNMAYEKAMLSDEDATFKLLDDITHSYVNREVNFKVIETKAELFLRICRYDSALHYASILCKELPNYSAGFLLQAQAYSYLAIQDSAVYYAERVLDNSPTLEETNNALYILTNDDESKDKAAIRQTAADRSDTQKLIELRQMKISQAAQLLEQDIVRKPDLRWLYAVIVTIIVIGSCILFYVHKKRSQHKLLSQQVDDLNKINDSVKQRHEHIQKEYTEYKDNLLTQMEQNYAVLIQSPNIFTDIHWKEFNALCQIINDNFGMLAAKLQGIYHLSEKEIRLCILVLLEITNSKQMAEMLYYSESGIRNFKNRTAKKLGTNSIEMRNALLKLAISEYPNAANKEIVHA